MNTSQNEFNNFSLEVWRTLSDQAKGQIIREKPGMFIDFLTVDFWNELTDELKANLIFQLLEDYPGQPFEMIDAYTQAIQSLGGSLVINARDVKHIHNALSRLLLPKFCGYIPDLKVEKLRHIIQLSDDSDHLSLLDGLLSKRECACEKFGWSWPFSFWKRK